MSGSAVDTSISPPRPGYPRAKPRRLAIRVAFVARVAAYFRGDLPRIGLLVALMSAGIAVGLMQAWPVALLLDSVVAQEPRAGVIHRLFLAIMPPTTEGRIVALAVSVLVLRVASELLGMARTLLGFRIGYAGLMRVRCDLYRKLQALHLGYHRSQPQGDALYRVTNDAAGLQALLQVAVSLVGSLSMLVAMLAIMASRHTGLTLVALGIVPLLFFTNLHYGKAFETRCTAAKEEESTLTTTVTRAMGSIGLVQAFGREAEEAALFHSTVRSSIKAWLRLHADEVRYMLAIGAIFGVGGAAVFGYGGWLVYRDQVLAPRAGGMTIGDLTVFLAYLALLYDPLCKLSGAGASIQSGAAGARRVFEVLDRDPVIADAPDAAFMPTRPRTLELDGVSFGYREDQPVLRDVHVRIDPGEMVAFVGSSGVGKSTLLNLLPRFHDPTSGAVRFDGHDARSLRVRDLRRHVALALQDSVLLPTSVAENIAYGKPEASNAEIRRAAALAGAASFIDALPEGYATQVADHGANFSGGQRQRIAIARALLAGAPILVLDEPTSALDSEHEQLVTESLRGLKGSRTIVLVSHRLSTVVDCDRIYVLEAGRIVEEGTHAELLARRGGYQEMARPELRLSGERGV